MTHLFELQDSTMTMSVMGSDSAAKHTPGLVLTHIGLEGVAAEEKELEGEAVSHMTSAHDTGHCNTATASHTTLSDHYQGLSPDHSRKQQT